MKLITVYAAIAMLCGNVLADDAKDPKKAFLTSEEAGPEFAVQGEYTGTIKVGDNEAKLGVQVISEGNNKLAWAAFIGGLPGDGWDGNPPMRGAGEVNGKTGVLKGETGQGELKDGSLVITNADKVRLGEISKTTRVTSRSDANRRQVPSCCSTEQRPIILKAAS